MFMFRIVFILFVLISLSVPAFSQIPKPLKDVKVTASIIINKERGLYSYNYTIYNPPINEGQIRRYELDIKDNLQNIVALKREGLEHGYCYSKAVSEDVLQKVSVVPVGIDSLRERLPDFPNATIWGCGFTMDGKASWGSADELYRIMPGKTLYGFKLTSYGLPGIRDAILMPAIEYDSLPDEYYGNVELSKQLQDSLEYCTKTLGPTAPPSDFKPLEFIDYIIGMKHEAFSLGWIRNEGIERSLDSKLDGAKKKLKSGNTKAAVNILNAFVKEVEAQGCPTYEDCPDGKHLTSEAYALMKYNAEYLIGRLKD